MKRERIIGLFCWVILCGLAASPATAQRMNLSAGIGGIYEYGLWLYADDIIGDAPRETSADGVTGLGYALWLNDAFIFDNLFSRDLGLTMNWAYGGLQGERRRTMPSTPFIGTGGDLDSFRFRSDIVYSARVIRLELLSRYRLLDPLHLESGFWGSYRINEIEESSYTRSDFIITPVSAIYSNVDINDPLTERGRRRVYEKDARFTSSRISWGLTAGVLYDILTVPIDFNGSRELIIYSTAHLRGDLDALRDEVSWHSLGVGGGLGIRIDLLSYGAADSPADDASSSQPVPELSPLRASIDLYSEGADGRREQTFPVRRQSVVATQHIPFIPVVYFGRESDTLPERYTQLAPGDRSFASDSLAGRDLRWLHYQGLNVLGLRMKQAPKETITLTGTIAAGETTGLGRRRADRVRRYLHDVWDVEERRVKLGEREGDEPSVLAENASQAIAGPVRTQWRVAGLDAPQLGLRPAMDGGAGLRRWEIIVKLGERRIGYHSSDGSGGDEAIDMGMALEEMNGDAARPVLTAELTVVDSLGAVVVSRDSLPVEISPERSARRRSLHLLFAPERAAEGAPVPGLETIAEEARSGGRISVRYASQAPEGSNPAERYAAHVARSLAALLRQREISGAEPVLVPTSPPPTEGWPEDHLFSSAVTVEVEWEE